MKSRPMGFYNSSIESQTGANISVYEHVALLNLQNNLAGNNPKKSRDAVVRQANT